MYYFIFTKLRRMTMKALVLTASVSFILILSILTSVIQTADAFESSRRVKKVTSIKIEEGDSLWSIAKEYITPEYSDINIYIKEIKKSNGMTTNIIYKNQYIIVPYYSEV